MAARTGAAGLKYLLDEMLSGTIATQLVTRGVDTFAVQDRPELRQLEDPDVFAFAQSEQRTVVTYNRDDFLEIERLYVERGEEHHGLIVLNSHRFPQRQPSTLGHLVKSLAAFASDHASGFTAVHWLQ